MTLWHAKQLSFPPLQETKALNILIFSVGLLYISFLCFCLGLFLWQLLSLWEAFVDPAMNACMQYHIFGIMLLMCYSHIHLNIAMQFSCQSSQTRLWLLARDPSDSWQKVERASWRNCWFWTLSLRSRTIAERLSSPPQRIRCTTNPHKHEQKGLAARAAFKLSCISTSCKEPSFVRFWVFHA